MLDLYDASGSRSLHRMVAELNPQPVLTVVGAVDKQHRAELAAPIEAIPLGSPSNR